jgi:hypothetical protein
MPDRDFYVLYSSPASTPPIHSDQGKQARHPSPERMSHLAVEIPAQEGLSGFKMLCDERHLGQPKLAESSRTSLCLSRLHQKDLQDTEADLSPASTRCSEDSSPLATAIYRRRCEDWRLYSFKAQVAVML